MLATSLVDSLQRPLDMTGVLLSLLAALQSRWQNWGAAVFEPQAAAFRRRCILDGRTVQVSSGSRLITGRCLGIDDNGSLVSADGKWKGGDCFGVGDEHSVDCGELLAFGLNSPMLKGVPTQRCGLPDFPPAG